MKLVVCYIYKLCEGFRGCLRAALAVSSLIVPPVEFVQCHSSSALSKNLVAFILCIVFHFHSLHPSPQALLANVLHYISWWVWSVEFPATAD